MLKHVLRTVTHQFDQKLWMTVGLMTFFTTFFVIFAYRLRAHLSIGLVKTLIAQAIAHPWTFGYAGLAFVCYISFLIYSVRLIIIQVYKLYTERD